MHELEHSFCLFGKSAGSQRRTQAEHIRKLHSKWTFLKKDINRKTAKSLANKLSLQESINYLFDIAHQDAMTIIKITEDRLFLEAQREKSRRGTIGGFDTKLALVEKRGMNKKAAALIQAAKASSSSTAILNTNIAVSDDDSFSKSSGADDEDL